MKLRGTVKHIEEVEVSPADCLEAIEQLVGVRSVLHPSRGYRWRSVGKGSDTKLVEEEDISYHGSECWRPTGIEVGHPNTIKLIEACQELERAVGEACCKDD